MPRPGATIRDDPKTSELWREFRAAAIKQGITTRQAETEAIKLWLEKNKEKGHGS